MLEQQCFCYKKSLKNYGNIQPIFCKSLEIPLINCKLEHKLN